MIPLLSFGKTLMYAIDAYRAGEYSKAEILFDQALMINKLDFTANFGKLRISLLKHDFDTARNQLTVCKRVEKSSEANSLLKPFEEYLDDQSCQSFEIINKNADDKLEYYNHLRKFKLADIVKACLIAFFAMLIYVQLPQYGIISSEISTMTKVGLFFLFYAPMIIIFYYRKAAIIPNVYILFNYIYKRAYKLLCSKQFIINSVFIVVFSLSLGGSETKRSLESFFTISGVILLGPICEEIFTRGILYGYIRKYNKKVSWTITTLIFYLLHADEASLAHIALSLFCLDVYDKEKTIVAPIFCHSLFNAARVVAIWLF